MTETKARECWRSTYPNAEKRRAQEEKRGEVTWFFSAEQMEEAYTAGYLAATESRAPVEPGVVTTWEAPGSVDETELLLEALREQRCGIKGCWKNRNHPGYCGIGTSDLELADLLRPHVLAVSMELGDALNELFARAATRLQCVLESNARGDALSARIAELELAAERRDVAEEHEFNTALDDCRNELERERRISACFYVCIEAKEADIAACRAELAKVTAERDTLTARVDEESGNYVAMMDLRDEAIRAHEVTKRQLAKTSRLLWDVRTKATHELESERWGIRADEWLDVVMPGPALSALDKPAAAEVK